MSLGPWDRVRELLTGLSPAFRPENAAHVRAAPERLTAMLEEHFAREERELLPALEAAAR